MYWKVDGSFSGAASFFFYTYSTRTVQHHFGESFLRKVGVLHMYNNTTFGKVIHIGL